MPDTPRTPDTTVAWESVRELAGPPSLPALFAKAAISGIRKSAADSLPVHGYARSGVTVDPGHLAEYGRVCGFRLSDTLPVTYPHLLAFPLQTKLMTDGEFPFPLIGLVHVANRIEAARPIRAGERLVVRVAAANLRPHERGRQFDMVSEVLADGAVVWHEVSTYLRRESDRESGRESSGHSEKSRTDPVPPENPSAVWRVPADIGRRYAGVSGDHNPIHLHPLSAKLFGFPGAIAHGMWSAARCLAFFEGKLPDAYAVDVRFKLPVRLPATVALTVDDGRFGLVGARSGKPHLEGTITER